MAEENESNPWNDSFPFDILEVGKSFELDRDTEEAKSEALRLCTKYSIDGKKFISYCKDRFIRIERTI